MRGVRRRVWVEREATWRRVWRAVCDQKSEAPFPPLPPPSRASWSVVLFWWFEGVWRFGDVSGGGSARVVVGLCGRGRARIPRDRARAGDHFSLSLS